MKNSLKIKLITILSTLVLCLTAFLCVNTIKSPTVVFAEENSLVTVQSDATLVEFWDISATEDDNVIANLYAIDGGYSLEITGSGKMKDFTWDTSDDGYQYSPWSDLYGNDLIFVTIGDNITSIGGNSFEECYKLVEIYNKSSMNISAGSWDFNRIARYALNVYTPTIGESKLLVAGDYVIYNEGQEKILVNYVGSSENVSIPTYITSINKYAFYGDSSMVSLLIPNGVNSIGDYAFSECLLLKSVCVPESIVQIGQGAFNGSLALEEIKYDAIECADLDEYSSVFGSAGQGGEGIVVTIGKSVKRIPSYLFHDDNWSFSGVSPRAKVKKVIFEENSCCESIGEAAFYNCYWLEDVEFSENLKTIETEAFSYCEALTTIEIPNSVITIGDFAFYACTSLMNVMMGDSLMSIGEGTFADCTSLSNVAIGKSVESIGCYAFGGCSSLSNITFNGTEESWNNISKGEDWNSNVPTIEINFSVDYAEGIVFTLINNGTEYSITDYTGSSPIVKIPSVYNGLPVTSIGDYAFSQCSNLTNIVISDSVESIGYRAFYNCTSLTSVKIGNKVQSIGEYAFLYCSSLTSIEIPNSVTSIGISAFSRCSSLKSITLPFVGATLNGTSNTHFGCIFGASSYRYNDDYVSTALKTVVITGGESIDNYAFYGCSSLTSIEIPNSVTSIGKYAFCNCSSLEGVGIPNSVTSMGAGVFSSCTSLTSIEIGNGVISIGDSAFESCRSIERVDYLGTIDNWASIEFVNLYSSPLCNGADLYINYQLVTEANITTATKVSDLAFSNCSSLTSVTIGNSVTSIGRSAFCLCTSLVNVTIGNNVTTIGVATFSSCSSLASVTIGNGVTSIGEQAFYMCSSLKSVIIGNNVTTIGEYAFYDCPIESAIIPTIAISYIQKTNLKTVVINGGESIGNSAFYNCSSLTSVTIGDSVTNIGDYAFKYCTSLTEIKYNAVNCADSSSSSSIDVFSYAGQNGEGIKVTIGSNVKKIPTYLFYDSYITEVIFEEGSACENIGDSAFRNCTALTSIEIPNSVTSIGYAAFYSCDSLYSIVIGNGVTSIGDYAFYSCDSLKSVEIPDSVKSIGADAFGYCSALKSLTIGSSVTSIGAGAFFDCSFLEKVNYAETIDSWVQIEFGNCYSNPIYYAKNLYINDKLVTEVNITTATKISSYALYNCSSLTSIEIPNSVISIGTGSFRGCSLLESITLPFVGATLNGTSDTHFGYIFGASSYSSNSSYIPISLKTVVVTGGESIGEGAFYGCKSLISITIPDSVTSIGKDAFYGCKIENAIIPTIAIPYITKSNLKVVIITSGESIGSSAFWDCDSLTSIVISDNVTSIGKYAFYTCSSLTSVTIGGGVTSIGDGAFEYCSSLEKVNYAETIDSWVQIEFGNCYSNPLYYAKNLYINDVLCDFTNVVLTTATKISSYAFSNCSSLTSITIPDSITSIGDGAFSNCTSLTSVVIGDNVTSIGDGAFSNCSSLTSVVIGDNVTSIGDYTFHNCDSLKDIEISNSVTSIGVEAFYCCASLKSLTIGKNVISIGVRAFFGCGKLVKVNYLGTIDEWVELGIGSNFGNQYNLYVNNSLLTEAVLTDAIKISNSAFKNCSSLTSVAIGDSVTSIGSYAFYNCYSLTSVTIGSGVTSIGNDAFYWCRSLTSVTIGGGVTSIGEYAFYNCSSLTSVTFGEKSQLTSIGDSAFGSCDELTNIEIPNSVTSIGDNAFSSCHSLKSIVIPNSVTSIGDRAFLNCFSLTSVEIPNSVTSIGVSTFYNCSSLTIIEIPNSVIGIGEQAFYRCNSLKSVTIGNNVTSIDKDAFFGCSSLEKVNYLGTIDSWVQIGFANGYSNPLSYAKNLYINDKLVTEANITTATKINDYAFYGCASLTNVTIGNSVTSIGENAFSGCLIEEATMPTMAIPYIPKAKLKTVVINGGENIGYRAFAGCELLNSIIIGDSVTSISEDAFSNSSAKNFYVFKDYNALSEFECVLIDGYGEIESGFNFVKLKGKNDAIVIGDGQLNSNKHIDFLKKDAALLMFDEGITSISGSVFSGNNSLRRIVLSSSVTDLGQGVFTDCSGLLSVYVDADYSYGFNKKLLDLGLEGFTVYYNGKTLGWDEINSYNPDADKEYLYWTNDGSGYTVSEFGEIMYLESIVIDGNTYYRDAQGIIYSNVNGSDKTIDIVGFEDISVYSENIVIPKVIVIGGDNYSIGSITSTAFISEDSLKIRTISLYGKINQIDNGAFSGCTNLLALYVRGEKPNTIASDIFSSDNSAKRKIAIVVLGDDSAWKNVSINNATVYEGEDLNKNKIDGQGIVYTLDITNGTAIVGTKSNSVGEGNLVNYNGVNTSGSTAKDIEIPDFVIYDYEIYMVIGFDRFAFYKSPATSVEFGAFIGAYETANTPAVWECTFREMANIKGFAVDSQNDKYYVDEVGALYGDGFKVKVKVAMVYINDININVKLYSRLIKAPANVVDFTVKEGTTVIEKYAFSRSNIQSVNLNDVNVIGSHAFYACPYLIKVSGGAVYYIEDSAFESTPIRTFNFENLTHIGERAFYNTDISGSVAIRADVAIIGDNAFSRCENISEFAYKVIETVRFDPETQEEILEKQEVSDKYPIYDGVLFKSTENGLKLLQYPLAKTDATYDMSKIDGSIYEISAYAFYGAKHLENIIMSNDTVLVGGYAFADISTLKKATIGQSYYGSTLNEDGLYSIGLFTNSNLSEIVVAEGNRYFKSDASGALYSKDMKVLYCYPAGIERVVYTVPYQTEVIYSNAFFGNTHLARIIILNEDFKEVGDQAFAQCSNLKEVFFRLENLPNSGVKVFDNDQGVKAKFLKATNNNLPAYWDFAEVETYSVITELGNQTVKTSDYTFVIVDTNGNSMYNARIALYIDGRGYYLSTNEFGIVVFSEADGIFDDGVERLIYVSKDGYFTHKQMFYPDNEMKISYITLSKEPTVMGVSCEGNDINSTVYDLNLAMYGDSYFDSETGKTVEGYIKKDVNGNIVGVDETVAKVSEKINISVVAYLDSGVVPTSCSLIQGDKILQTLENGETSGSQVTYNFWVEYTKFIEDEIIYAQLITKYGEDEKTQKIQLNVNVFNFIITEDQINLNTEDISVDLSGNASILSTLIGSDKLDFSIGKNTKINIVPDGDSVTVTLGSKKEKSKSYNSNKEGYNDNHEAHNKNTYHFKFMGIVEGKDYSFNVRFAKGTEDLGYCYYMLSIYEGYYAKDKVVEKYGVVNGVKGLVGRNAYASKASLIYASYLTSAVAKENIKEGQVYSEAVGSFDENKNLSTKSSFELSLSGSLKFKYDKNEIRLTEGEIKGAISVGFKMQQQYVVWIIPVVLEVDMGVDGTVNLSLRVDKQNAPITIESAKAKIEANLDVSLGVGCSWASIGVYGGVGTVFILEFAPNIGIDEWSINGKVGWYVKALFFEKKGEIWSGNYTIIDDYYWYTWNESGEYGQVSLTSMYLVENYEVEDREKMQEQAKLIVCEGKLYKIFYVDAFNQNSNNYDNYNYRKLAVAEWSGSEWINVKLIDDNGYNDQSYNVYEQNGKLYVAYLQQSEKLIDTTVNDTYYVSENLLLKSAIIDLSNFDMEICKEEITKTFGYKYLQNYAVINGQQVMVWVENSDNNMFGVSPNNYVDANGNSHVFKTTANSIYTSVFNGKNWSEPILLASGLAPVTSLTISNDGTVVYNLDEDCDLSTLSDRVVYYLDGSEQVKLVQVDDNEEIISILVKDGKVFCYCKRIEINGNDITEVYYLEEYNVGANTSVIDVIKHKVNIATDAYQTVYDEDGNLVGIIYTKNNKDNTGTAIYGKFSEGSVWGEEVLVVESIIDYYIAEYSASMIGNYLHFTIDYINGQGEFIQSSIIQREITSDVVIQSSIDYIARKAYITITNNGLKAANVTCQYCNDIRVLSGCSYVYEISFNDFNSDVEESITITVDGKELSNKVVIPLEYSDLRIVAKEVVLGENRTLIIGVTNDGNVVADATLYVSAGINGGYLAMTGKTVDVIGIAPGQTKYYNVTVDSSIIKVGETILTLYINVSDGSELGNSIDNNCLYFSLEELEEIDVESMGMVIEPTISESQVNIDKHTEKIEIEYTCDADASIRDVVYNGSSIFNFVEINKDNKTIVINKQFLDVLGNGAHDIVIVFENSNNEYKTSKTFNVIKNMTVGVEWEIAGETMSFDNVEYGGLSIIPKYVEETSEKYFWFDLNGNKKVEDSEKICFKLEKEGYDYLFVGWDKNEDGKIDAISQTFENIRYVAVFREQAKEYVVTWIFKNASEEDVFVNETYFYGNEPVYKGTIFTPINKSFVGYDKEISTVSSNIVYTAVYEERGSAIIKNTETVSAWDKSFMTTISIEEIANLKNMQIEIVYDALKVELLDYVCYPNVNIISVNGNVIIIDVNISDGAMSMTIVDLVFKAKSSIASGMNNYMTITNNPNLSSNMNGVKIYEIGDANMDGNVDVIDLMMIKSASLGKITLTENQKAYANATEDYTEDGGENINVLDMMKIKQFILNKTNTVGERISVDFVGDEQIVEYSMSIVKGTTPEGLPEIEEGYVWSLSQESYEEVDFTKFTINTLIYKIKENYLAS